MTQFVGAHEMAIFKPKEILLVSLFVRLLVVRRARANIFPAGEEGDR
jgi:hypothetical protein